MDNPEYAQRVDAAIDAKIEGAPRQGGRAVGDEQPFRILVGRLQQRIDHVAPSRRSRFIVP